MENINIIDVLEESFEGTRIKTPSRRLTLDKIEDLYSFIQGFDPYEGISADPKEIKEIIKQLRKLKSKFDNNEDDEKPSHIRKKLLEIEKNDITRKVEKILDKIDDGKVITAKEHDIYDEFVDKINDVFIDLKKSKFVPDSEGKSGGKENKILWEHSFPIKYTLDSGKSYYGLVRAPSGIITWQSDEARYAIENENELPKSLHVMSNYKLSNSKLISDLEDKLKYKDDNKTKEKVQAIYEKHGAEIKLPKGSITGLEKALKKIEFWKDIKSLF